jgi:hypothetical protein
MHLRKELLQLFLCFRLSPKQRIQLKRTYSQGIVSSGFIINSLYLCPYPFLVLTLYHIFWTNSIKIPKLLELGPAEVTILVDIKFFEDVFSQL